jgi:hypothetical protein
LGQKGGITSSPKNYLRGFHNFGFDEGADLFLLIGQSKRFIAKNKIK